MELYRFTAPPMFINDNLMVEIKSDDHLLAVNKRSTRYASFSPQQLAGCIRVGTTYSCNDGSVLRNHDHNNHRDSQFSGKSIDQCLFAVYNSMEREIPLRCDLNVDVPRTRIRQTSPTTFLIATIEHARGTVDCEDGHTKAFSIQGSQELTLSTSCTATILGFTLHTGDDITVQAEHNRPLRFDFDTPELFNLQAAYEASSKLSSNYQEHGEFPTTLDKLNLDQEEESSAAWRPAIISMASTVGVIIVSGAIATLGLQSKFKQYSGIMRLVASPKVKAYLDQIEEHLAQLQQEESGQNTEEDQNSKQNQTILEMRNILHTVLSAKNPA